MKKEIKNLRKIEGRINRNLYAICAVVTILTMTTILVEFFTRGDFMPANIELFYLGVLVIYSLHKELLRLLGKKSVSRQGEYFVYAWIFLTAILYLVNFLMKGYYTNLSTGEQLTILKDLSVLTIEVLAVFIFTRSLKILKILIIKPQGPVV